MIERPLSAQPVRSARPTIRVGDREQALVSELALSMRMTESEGGMSRLELRLSQVASERGGGARTGVFEDEAVLRLGVALTIYAGEEDRPQEIFRGRVTGLEATFSEGPPELVVLAEDALARARMNRTTTIHRDASIASIARSVAQRAGLRPLVSGFDETIGSQVQLNESDLAFLRRLLCNYDGDMQVVGDELHVLPRSQVRRDEVTLALHSQLSWARVTADLNHQTTSVSTSGWDSTQGRRVQFTSTGRAIGPGRGRTGAEILRQTLGPRTEHVGHVPVVDDRDASSLAHAAFDQRARRLVVIEGTAEGNPSLRVGAHVKIKDLSSRFDNTYYITHACHRYDVKSGEMSGGYFTDFEGECAYLGAPR